MAPSPADFSQITELLEVKKLYEEAEERHRLKLVEKDEEISRLTTELADLRGVIEAEDGSTGELQGKLEQLQAENQRLRDEANQKVNALNERIRDLNQRLKEASGGKAPTGFFKR